MAEPREPQGKGLKDERGDWETLHRGENWPHWTNAVSTRQGGDEW